MPLFHSTITIAARAERIWALLIDGAAWPNWTSTVERVEGTVAAGAAVTVVPSGGLPLALFRGLRTYELNPLPDDRVSVSITMAFSGPLAPLINPSIPDLQPSFDAFAADLKAAAEGA